MKLTLKCDNCGKTHNNQDQYNSFIKSSETSLYDVDCKSNRNGEYIKVPFYIKI